MASRALFIPSLRKREVPFRGKLSSKDYNTFQDEAVTDMSRISTAINSLAARFDARLLQLEGELRGLQAAVMAARIQKKQEDLFNAIAGNSIYYHQSFNTLDDVRWDGIDPSRRLQIDRIHGKCMLPVNRRVSRFYYMNPSTDELFTPADLTVVAAAVDEGDGDVVVGDPSLAVDGKSGEGYIRRVIFSADTDQRYVTADFTITVPTAFADRANLLTLFPSPAGEVDVLNVLYSTTDAAPVTALQVYDEDGNLSSFSPQYEVHSLQLHFAVLGITSLTVRVRQSRSILENAERVFQYGFKEIHLDLIELDKTTIQAVFKSSNSVYFKVDAPDGYKFSTLSDLRSYPNFADVSSYMIIQIFGNNNMVDEEIWDSASDVPLSTTAVSVVSSSFTSIYVGVKMAYDSGQGVSPVLDRFYLKYEVTAL